MPKVTILTPTYQHAKYIRACVESVLAQSSQDWEQIVLDDGSTDGTPEIVEAIGDPRVRVLRRRHQGLEGLGALYSDGLSMSDSELVAIIEGDDEWPTDKLAIQTPMFSDHAVVLSYGDADLIDEEGCIFGRYTYAPWGATAQNRPVGSIIPSLAADNFLVAPTVIVRRAALASVGGFVQPQGIPYVDHPTWLRLATVGPFARSSRVLGRWRRHREQWTTVGVGTRIPETTAYLADLLSEGGAILDPKHRSDLMVSVGRNASRQKQQWSLKRARLDLLDGRWSDAAKELRGLIRTGDPAIRAIACLGLASTVVRADIEWFFRLNGRHSWPSRGHRHRTS
jgi:glycosyltransferase involved in cell wall biosynthesis